MLRGGLQLPSGGFQEGPLKKYSLIVTVIVAACQRIRNKTLAQRSMDYPVDYPNMHYP